MAKIKLPKIFDAGMKRGFYRCRSCKNVFFSDYTPFGLSSGVFYNPCICLAVQHPGNVMQSITKKEFLRCYPAALKRRKRKATGQTTGESNG